MVNLYSFKLDLNTGTFTSYYADGTKQLDHFVEELKEGDDIVINQVVRKEQLGNKEILITPGHYLIKDKDKNLIVLIPNSFDDAYVLDKFSGVSPDDVELFIPYYAQTKTTEEGYIVKLKDGRIFRCGIYTFRKEKYRFLNTGPFLLPFYRTDVSRKKLQGMKDKIWLYEKSPRVPSKKAHQQARKLALEGKEGLFTLGEDGIVSSTTLKEVPYTQVEYYTGDIIRFEEPFSIINIPKSKNLSKFFFKRALENFVFNLKKHNSRPLEKLANKYQSLIAQSFFKAYQREACNE